MEINSEESSLSCRQKIAKLAAVVANVQDVLLDGFPEPDDSGIDSDDPIPAALLPSADCSTCSDEEHSDTPSLIQDVNTPAMANEDATHAECDSLDIFTQWKPGKDPEGCESPGHSSPSLSEIELTASDEDDDRSLIELVIPIRSRDQKPTCVDTYMYYISKLCIWATSCCCSRDD